MTTEARVREICEEYGIKIIDGQRYPGIKETRALATLCRLYDVKGEGHFRIVMTTAAETENNAGNLDKYLWWAISDLATIFSQYVDERTSEWLEAFDKTPVPELQVIASQLPHQRYALVGMMAERIVRAMGDGQGELFQRAVA